MTHARLARDRAAIASPAFADAAPSAWRRSSARVRKLTRPSATARRRPMRQLEELIRAVGDQPIAKELRELRQALRGVAPPQRRVSRCSRRSIRLRRQSSVLIGPWTGEVGFELLYWIPFLEWVRARWQLSPERELIVSRGGVASWYGRSADRYVDIFALFSADEFRGAVAEEKRKHRTARRI